MPVETRNMENKLATIVDKDHAFFNDSAIAHIEHCLSGSEFMLVGVSSHMKTVDLEWLLLHCGCTLTKHASELTNFVIKGSRVGDTMHSHTDKVEDLQMYKDAVEKGATVLSTLEFFQLISGLNPEISIQNLVEGWHENISFSLRDTSAYGVTSRHLHKYSLEVAKSNRSRCHGHCKNIIPEGNVRLKACFDPLTDSFVYFRCLKCITPTILTHIEKEWLGKGHGENLVDFSLAQPDEVLRMFYAPGVEPKIPDANTSVPLSTEDRKQLAQNLTTYMRQAADDEVSRRQEDHQHAKEKAIEAETGFVIPVEHGGNNLGKRKRHEVYSSAEMHEFMQSIPSNVIRTSSEEKLHSLKTTMPAVPIAT